MTSCAIVAYGAISGFGEGSAALGIGESGAPAPSVVERDPELEAAKLLRPFCARVRAPGLPPDLEKDRATALLERALASCAAELDEVGPGWRSARVGLAVGTSSGGMRAFEAAFAGTEQPKGVHPSYLGPLVAASRPCALQPVALVLGACASSTLAIGLAREWLRSGQCDIALCGGFDAVSVFVASGFEVLRAVCTDGRPRPFRVGRDGLALGEGAAVLALVRREDAARYRRPPFGFVTGFGASCDAVHLTAPDREGRGLARAAERALSDAGTLRVDLVSAHGTATEFNDASESKAILQIFGEEARSIPLHAWKGGGGHTLGAAGALETLAAIEALHRRVAPASAGHGPIEGGMRVLDRSEPLEGDVALKLSAAFGGANAALVLAAKHPADASQADASQAEIIAGDASLYVSHAVSVMRDVAEATAVEALERATGYASDKLARADDLVRLTMAVVARLRDDLSRRGKGALDGAGILVGHGLATIDTNGAYLARILSAGASRGEPRRFPYTTPNAAAGECAVAFGLTGPAFAVGGGPHGGLEALATAADLVRSGVADRMIVVAVDEAGASSRRLAPETRPGAVALLVSREPLAARLESWAVGLPEGLPSGAALAFPSAVCAHLPLLPLESGEPATLEAKTPWGGFANVRLFWL